MKDLTKAELLEKIKEQKHLASAVEAKDNEMSQLKESHRQLVDNFKKEIKEMQKEISDLKQNAKGLVHLSEVQEKIDKVKEENKNLVETTNLYIRMYHNYLKQTQHNLEMALFTEQVVSDKFKK